MKKCLSLLLAMLLIVGLSAPAFAERAVSYTVKLGGGNSKKVEMISHEDLAREVLGLVNQERKAEGLTPYVWDSALVAPAMRRGAEASVATDRQNSTHTRPDGSEWHTVSDLAKGENLAGGFDTPKEVVEAWMNSDGHRRLILKDNFTSMGVACMEDEEGTRHWVQLFGTSGGSSSESGSTAAGNSTSGTTGNSASGTTGTSATNSVSISADIEKALAGAPAGTTATLRVKDAQSITAAALRTAASSAATAGKGIVIHADTSSASGTGVQGRLYVEPSKLSTTASDLALGVYTQGTAVSGTKANFEKWFDIKAEVVSLSQQGSLGARLKVAASVDLSRLDTGNLKFYSYDKAASKYTLIADPSYTTDSSGFVYFYTDLGGDIVITDKTLSR